MAERNLVVVESAEGSDHLREHVEVESCVESLRLLDEGVLAEALRE